MKKAELSFQTIIIAAIVLIVLIVLWAIFVGNMTKTTGKFKEESTIECKSDTVGGTDIVTRQSCQSQGGFVIPGDYSDVTGNNICCQIP